MFRSTHRAKEVYSVFRSTAGLTEWSGGSSQKGGDAYLCIGSSHTILSVNENLAEMVYNDSPYQWETASKHHLHLSRMLV